MATNNESGHAKNVSNFNELINNVNGYGTDYNPSKDAIKVTALESLYANADASNQAVNAALSASTLAVDARVQAFAPVGKLITRVSKAFQASDATDQQKESLKSIVRKLQGTRVSAKLTDEEKKALEAEGKSTTEISTTQMGYDDRVNNLYLFNQFLASVPAYAPNETELQIASLNTLYDDLKTKNSTVISTTVALTNARINRNQLLYTDDTRLVDIAFSVKNYVSSVFGTTDPRYKQISGLTFRKPT